MIAGVLIIHAQVDSRYKEALSNQLAILKPRQLTAWDERTIGPDDAWQERLASQVDPKSFILLLITDNFLSKFCRSREVLSALEERSRSESTVIPLLCRPCPWNKSKSLKWLEDLEVWPQSRKPLWAETDDDPAQLLCEFAGELLGLVRERFGEPEVEVNEETPAEAFLRQLDELAAAEGLGPGGVAALIRHTISVGRELYNEGNVRGCARTYGQTVDYLLPRIVNRVEGRMRGSLRSARKRPPMGTPPDDLLSPMDAPSEVSDIMRGSPNGDPLEESPELEAAMAMEMKAARKSCGDLEQTADTDAWLMRDCFDRLLLMVRNVRVSLLPGLGTASATDFDVQRAAKTLLDGIDDIGGKCGLHTDDYEAGSHTAAALGLVGCLQLAEALMRRGRGGAWSASLQRCLDELRKAHQSSAEPYRILWLARLFLRTLALQSKAS